MSSSVTDDTGTALPPQLAGSDPDDALRCLHEALERVANLETALQTSRTIGIAVGILVERHRISPDEAFARIAACSQKMHRKLRDVASDLVYTGEEPIRAA